MHWHTITHTTEWLAADTHRWGAEGISKSKLSLPHCSTKQRWVFGLFRTCSDSVLFFSRSVLLFSDFLQFFLFLLLLLLFLLPPPLFFLQLGVSPRNTKKKERKKSNQFKKRGIKKKILFNFLILELGYFSPLVFVSFSPVCWCTSARCGCSGGVCAQGLRTRLSSQYAVF